MKQYLAGLLRRNSLTGKLMALRDLQLDISFLSQAGWFESRRLGVSVEAGGAPVPWLAYSAIAFLEPRVKAEWSVFEYGSGNSTKWWASRVARVVSCEHDREWADTLRAQLPGHVEYLHVGLDEGYSEVLHRFVSTFDIVVIDGRERVRCSRYASQALKPRGVIVWDNSDRPRYKPGLADLMGGGFRRLDFWGMSPISVAGSCTSILYPRDNCLEI